MTEVIQVAAPPPKPLLVFDGDCSFCRRWIRRWQQSTGDRIEYLPFQETRIADQFPELTREGFEKAVHLIETDGRVYRAAEAVFRSLGYGPMKRWPLRLYQQVPAVAPVTEWAYRLVAAHRSAFSTLTTLFWGDHIDRPSYHLVRWTFLRGLGVIYLIAFVSLWVQIIGLAGHNGILPADQFISALTQQAQQQNIGLDRYRLEPTLCWFNTSDRFLQLQCAAGAALSVLVMAGISPAPCLFLLWLLYLSLATIGRTFLGFQWDNLLLETGFLAIFLRPCGCFPAWRANGLLPRRCFG